ncbi:hypothetical protein GCM10027592_47040 [Spirosoma flavus]
MHLGINQVVQPASFSLTPGNVADNNHQVLHYLLDHLKGHFIGDKEYLCAFFEHFYQPGLHLITALAARQDTVQDEESTVAAEP